MTPRGSLHGLQAVSAAGVRDRAPAARGRGCLGPLGGDVAGTPRLEESVAAAARAAEALRQPEAHSHPARDHVALAADRRPPPVTLGGAAREPARAAVLAPAGPPDDVAGRPPAAQARLALYPSLRRQLARRRRPLLGRPPDGPLLHADVCPAFPPPPRLGEPLDIVGADVGRRASAPQRPGLLRLAEHRPPLSVDLAPIGISEKHERTPRAIHRSAHRQGRA